MWNNSEMGIVIWLNENVDGQGDKEIIAIILTPLRNNGTHQLDIITWNRERKIVLP